MTTKPPLPDFIIFASLPTLLLLGAAWGAQSSEIEVGKGPIMVTAIEPMGSPPVEAAGSSPFAETPPLGGVFSGVALAVTDQRSGEEDLLASLHLSFSGNLLPTRTRDYIPMILDSGAATTLVGYEEAVSLGLVNEFISSSGFLPIGGAGGSIIILGATMPVGFFAHGLQHLSPAGVQTNLLQGQGNFSAGVNTLANFQSGQTIPTVLGAPFFAYFVSVIRHSQLVPFPGNDDGVRSPSVELFPDPLDPLIPALDWEIDLRLTPTPGPVAYTLWFDLDTFEFVPLLPSLIGLDSTLYETQNSVVLSNDSKLASGNMIVDTAALGTIISEAAATQLGLVLLNPDFEVEVKGIGGSSIRPGFYIDSLKIAAQPTRLSLPSLVEWNNVPVVVVNISGSIFGIMGMNLFGARDIVFDGVSSTPQLKISQPIVSPDLQISDITFTISNNTVEVDWLTQPAPPVLVLEKSENIGDASPTWSAIATGELSSVTGMMSVTGAGNSAVFRLAVP